MLKLFDTCIVPILLYGCEVWAPFMDHDYKIEKVHTQFLKRLLGVSSSTTNVLVSSELGRHSLQGKIATRNISFNIKYGENMNTYILVKQAASYEPLYAGKRDSLYSLLEKRRAKSA